MDVRLDSRRVGPARRAAFVSGIWQFASAPDNCTLQYSPLHCSRHLISLPGTAPRLRHELPARPAHSLTKEAACRHAINTQTSFSKECSSHAGVTQLKPLAPVRQGASQCLTACSLACRRGRAPARARLLQYPALTSAVRAQRHTVIPAASCCIVRRCRRVYSVHRELRTRKQRRCMCSLRHELARTSQFCVHIESLLVCPSRGTAAAPPCGKPRDASKTPWPPALTRLQRSTVRRKRYPKAFSATCTRSAVLTRRRASVLCNSCICSNISQTQKQPHSPKQTLTC